MRCTACDLDLPENARFCPSCGLPQDSRTRLPGPEEAAATAEPVQPLTVEGGERGAWRWILILLLALERLVAWWAFPLEDPSRVVAEWESTFFWIYGLAGFLLTASFLALRNRAGGWLAGLSGLALLIRSCGPLLGEKPADGAIWALMVASATLTFAFFHEQSWWGRSPSVQGSASEED